MQRSCVWEGIALVFLIGLSSARGQDPHKPANIHLRIVDHSGEDLGDAKVTEFRANANGKDFSARFQHNNASSVPYGVYHLRAHATGFYSAERDVQVFQPDVWVVLGLTLGEEGGPSRFSIEGTVTGHDVARQPVWLRLFGIESGLVVDGRADETGKFILAGIPQGRYVLISIQRQKVIGLRPIRIPLDGRVIIDANDK